MKKRITLAFGVLALLTIGILLIAVNRESDETAQVPTSTATLQPSSTKQPSLTFSPTPAKLLEISDAEMLPATSTPIPTFTPTVSPSITSTEIITAVSPTATVEITPLINSTPTATRQPAVVQPTEEPTHPPPPPPPPSTAQRLIIPVINVDAPIVPVGLDATTGSMAAPVGWFDIGWYRYGPRPGYPGSAALAGHLDTNTGSAAAFWNLDQLVPGDTIIYQASNGSQLPFIVEETAFYPWDQVPLDRIFARSGEPRVSLITCGGQWSRNNLNYSHRTIVYARLQH